MDNPAKMKPPSIDDSKETYGMKLGEYRGAIKPLCFLMCNYAYGVFIIEYTMRPDPRVQPWLLMQNSGPIFGLSVIYILFSVVWGPRLMKNRNRLDVRKMMIVYNALQVIANTYIFLKAGFLGWFFDYKWFCQPCDYSWSPKALAAARVTWLFFFTKGLDFFDTMFFILNKKHSQITLLHVVHHSSMYLLMWYGTKYAPGGHLTFVSTQTLLVVEEIPDDDPDCAIRGQYSSYCAGASVRVLRSL